MSKSMSREHKRKLKRGLIFVSPLIIIGIIFITMIPIFGISGLYLGSFIISWAFMILYIIHIEIKKKEIRRERKNEIGSNKNIKKNEKILSDLEILKDLELEDKKK